MRGAGSCSPEVKTRFRSWLSGFTIVQSSPSATFSENGWQRPTAGPEDPQVQAGGWKKPPLLQLPGLGSNSLRWLGAGEVLCGVCQRYSIPHFFLVFRS